MLDSGHRARCVAFVRMINSKDRSLEGVRYVKIAAFIEGQGVGRGKAVSKRDVVLGSVRIAHRARRRRPNPGNSSDVFDLRCSVKLGFDPLNLGSAKVADIDLVVPRVKLKPQERSPTKLDLGNQITIFLKPQKLVGVGTKVEGGHVNLFSFRIGGDPFRKTNAVRQRDESLRCLPFDNDIFARQYFAMRRNDQGHECRKNREFFHFRAPFWLKTPLRCYAYTSLLKLTRKPPRGIGPRLRRTLFISMTGVLSNGKN